MRLPQYPTRVGSLHTTERYPKRTWRHGAQVPLPWQKKNSIICINTNQFFFLFKQIYSEKHHLDTTRPYHISQHIVIGEGEEKKNKQSARQGHHGHMAVGSSEDLKDQTFQQSDADRDNKGQVCSSGYSDLDTQSPIYVRLPSKEYSQISKLVLIYAPF